MIVEKKNEVFVEGGWRDDDFNELIEEIEKEDD